LRLTNSLRMDFFGCQSPLDALSDSSAELDLERNADGTDGEQNSAMALNSSPENNCPQYLFAGVWPRAGGILDTNWPPFPNVDLEGQPALGSCIEGFESAITHRDGASSFNQVPSTPRRRPGAKHDPQTGWFYDDDKIIDEAYGVEPLCKFVSPPADALSPTGPVSWRLGQGHAAHSADGGKNSNLTRRGSFLCDGDIAAMRAGNVSNLKPPEFTVESCVRRANPILASLDAHAESALISWRMSRPGGLVSRAPAAPEPGAAAILGIGLALTCVCRLRRRPK
jgi:hypothetical protein